MKAIVVYESLWGNTAAIARAIAEGFGNGAVALSTAEATPEAVPGADWLIAGAPLVAFRLPPRASRANLRAKSAPVPRPPDLSHPPLRDWLAALPPGQGRAAAFETRIWWSPGSASGSILRTLKNAGYAPAAWPKRFRVAGMVGPLKPGEIERARRWGQKLAHSAP